MTTQFLFPIFQNIILIVRGFLFLLKKKKMHQDFSYIAKLHFHNTSIEIIVHMLCLSCSYFIYLGYKNYFTKYASIS